MNCQILTYNTHGLPWSKDQSKEIAEWICTRRPQIVFLQEVFLSPVREFYKSYLERAGYRVCIPADQNVSMLPSGLLSAFLDSEYTLLNSCFCPYLSFHNVEWFSNKGFHCLHLQQVATRQKVHVINTHTQSDTEVSWWFGRQITHNIRKRQIGQILDHCRWYRDPVIVAGDLNCEISPHPYLRFLQSPCITVRKSTFYSTGEDLDHFCWLPLQWSRGACTFCNIDKTGPQLRSCRIFDLPWSDHAPVLGDIFIPALPK